MSGPARAGAAASGRRLRTAGMVLVALVLGCLAWELYKAVAPPDGASVLGVRVLPRSDDVSMPHVTDVLYRLGQPELSSPGSPAVWTAVVAAAWFTFKAGMAGWAIGVVVGLLLACLMQRFRPAEHALLPYVVLSQTVPLIALAPLVVGWGGRLALFGQPWQPWMSVSLIAAYLAFFPVAVGALRGLQSPDGTQLGLMRGYAASWWATLLRLRLPASVPYLLPSLRLAAAASVIGAIVAEISTGTRGGIGRLIVEYAQSATGDPAKPYVAILGAAVLGLVAAGLVSLVGLALRRYRTVEVAP